MFAGTEERIITMVQKVYGIPAAVFAPDGSAILESADPDSAAKPAWYYNLAKNKVEKATADHKPCPICGIDEVGYTWASYPLMKGDATYYLIVGPLYVQSFHVRFDDEVKPDDPAWGSAFVLPTYRWDLFRKLLEAIGFELYGEWTDIHVLTDPDSSEEDDYISFDQYIATHSEIVEQRECGFRLLHFITNCIESGNAEDLYMVISDSATADFIKLLLTPQRTSVIDLFAYVAALSAEAAIRGNVTDLEASTTYGKHMKLVHRANTMEGVIQCMVKMWLDFVYLVQQQATTEIVFSPLVLKAFEYINGHVCETISIDDMAKAIGVSSGYLMRNFKKETGKTVNEYIKDEKLKRACIYLKFFDYSIVDISERLAFCSQSHFAGCFKTAYGMTPGEYRKTANVVPLGD